MKIFTFTADAATREQIARDVGAMSGIRVIAASEAGLTVAKDAIWPDARFDQVRTLIGYRAADVTMADA